MQKYTIVYCTNKTPNSSDIYVYLQLLILIDMSLINFETKERVIMKLRHFTKAHQLHDIINVDKMLKRELVHLNNFVYPTRQLRKLAEKARGKLPRLLWFTKADRANTSFACHAMQFNVMFNEAFCIEVDSEEVGAIKWTEYMKKFRNCRKTMKCINTLNSIAISVGDDIEDYYVVAKDLDLEAVDYDLNLIRYEGKDLTDTYSFLTSLDVAMSLLFDYWKKEIMKNRALDEHDEIRLAA
jgi:hypothetical protein